MRNVVALGERRDGYEWDAYTELIKVRTVCRIWPCGIGSHRGAQLLCILHTGVRRAYGIAGTLRTSSGLLARRRIGQIFALAWIDAIRIESAVLRRCGRGGMIVKAAVLVIGQEDNGVFPVRT